ncbi:MAG: DUF4145 domain-containing protein [Scytolyngbya sp. HA4215-MV1]|nr:DUF4145 domain-containing protein [Scytolyngbya sp. HA4215-MV1]
MEPTQKTNTSQGLALGEWQKLWMTPPPKDKSSELPLDVEEDFRQDFKEAALTLSISPRASAALSRYALQKLLRKKAGVKEGDLFSEIKEVVESKALPSYLSEAIDAVRNIGNIAAHPMENKATGEIVEVERAESEWLLEILRSLLDFYFVQPALLQKKKEVLNQKLADAGKPPMK